ncbi:MAG: Uma2 family endonuclease [Pirellulaceae bacterium]|nr:Uma2 family endonuclease [Pirellulaceae bacterium]
MSIATSLITATEFGSMPDPGHPQELVRGVVVDMPPPKFRHGKICGRLITLLTYFSDERGLGHVLGNDSGVITERDPDTVRGADVAFVSYTKVAADACPEYLTVAPDAVFEVLSPSDRWSEVLRKVTEYLLMGVPAVYVLDPDTTRAHCYFPDRPEVILNGDDELVGIGPLSGWRVPVAKFFE